jgi:hypothetical protein
MILKCMIARYEGVQPFAPLMIVCFIRYERITDMKEYEIEISNNTKERCEVLQK